MIFYIWFGFFVTIFIGILVLGFYKSKNEAKIEAREQANQELKEMEDKLDSAENRISKLSQDITKLESKINTLKEMKND